MAVYQPKDRFYRKAREEGLPSRAAFKLEELLERYRLVAGDSRVLDLGCAPGGWLAVLNRAVPKGTVVGVDIVPCRPPAARVQIIVGDMRENAVRQAAIAALGGKADLVTSDMAPKLSGIRDRDQARLLELLETAIGVASDVLRPGGALIVKVFMGEGLREVVERLRRRFRSVESTHLRATRPGSRELYLVARGFRAAPP